MQFVKGHASGNDFILLPDPRGELDLDASLVQGLCDRRRGIGGDGVIRIAPARSGVDADVFMDYWNADGTVSEMCGNGVRCVAKFIADRGSRAATGDRLRIDTRGGVKPVEITQVGADGRVLAVRVDMGAPEVGQVGMKVELDDGSVEVVTLSMGNPHAVLVVDDLGDARVDRLGPAIETHPVFPDRTNVEFIAPRSPGQVHGRIWERGVGETLASGTGASAMAVAAHVLGLADRRVKVSLPGGTLEVDWTDQTLLVTGPAVEVAGGEIDETWLRRLSS